MVPTPLSKIKSAGVRNAAFVNLKPDESAVFLFIFREIKNASGPSSQPVAVPLIKISRILRMDYNKVRYCLRKLIRYGLVERFTAVHGAKHGVGFQRTSYFRLPFKF